MYLKTHAPDHLSFSETRATTAVVRHASKAVVMLWFLRRLADRIVEAQRRENGQMKSLIAELEDAH